MKKIIASIIVTGLLLIASIASVNAFDIEEETGELKTSGHYFHAIPFANVYVDDDNTQGPWDGTYEHPYQYIQDGVDNASTGDTIYVFSGIYYENIEIDKSIFLKGEDRDSTIIDGGRIESVVKITGDYVKISGFTTQKSKMSWPGSGILVESDYNSITGNTMSENGGGIDLIYSSSYNTISGNTIVRNSHGIALYSHCDNNTISGNTILNSHQDGICLYLSNNNSFSGNIITSNKLNGVAHHSSSNSIISGNIMSSNNEFGLALVDSNNCLVSDNTISSNNYSGLLIWIACGNNISDNIVSSNKDSGIRLETGSDDVIVCAYNIVSKNNVSNNDIGILLRGAHTNTISANTISDNNEYGIVLEIKRDFWGNLCYCHDNIIYHNNLINNDQQACDNCTNNNPSEDCTNLWYSSTLKEGNYWDDYEGRDLFPRDGIGDTPYDIPGPGDDIKDEYPLMGPYPDAYSYYNNLNSQSQQDSQVKGQSSTQQTTLSSTTSSSSASN